MYRIYSNAELREKRRQEGAVIRAGRRDNDEEFYAAISALYSGGDIDRMLSQRLVPPTPLFIFAAVADAAGILLTAVCLLVTNVFARLQELINISSLLLEGTALLLFGAVIGTALVQLLGTPVREHGRRALPFVLGLLLLPLSALSALSVLAVHGNRDISVFTKIAGLIGTDDPKIAGLILIGAGVLLLLILLYGMTAIPFDPVTRYVRVYRAMRPRWILRADTPFEEAKAFWEKRSTGDLSALLNSYGRAGCIEEAEWERSGHPEALAEVIGEARDRQKAEREKSSVEAAQNDTSPEPTEGDTAPKNEAAPEAETAATADTGASDDAADESAEAAPVRQELIFVPVTQVTGKEGPLGRKSADFVEIAPDAPAEENPTLLREEEEPDEEEKADEADSMDTEAAPAAEAVAEEAPAEETPAENAPAFRFPKFPRDPFYMLIDTCTEIPGVGCALTGKVSAGMLKAGSEALLCGYNRDTVPVVVEQITLFRAEMPYCQAGDPVSLLVTGMTAADYIPGLTLERHPGEE